MSLDTKTPKSIQTFLSNHSPLLHALATHATEIARLQKLLRTHFEQPFADHLIVANYTNTSLTLHTDSPAWATKLRFNIPKIIKVAQNTYGLPNLQSVRVKVFIPESVIDKPKKRMSMSSTSALLLRKTAESITDKDLQTALLRLTEH